MMTTMIALRGDIMRTLFRNNLTVKAPTPMTNRPPSRLVDKEGILP